MLSVAWVPLLFLAANGARDNTNTARTLAATYKPAAARIIETALADDGAWNKLAQLCDRVGARQSGSPAMAQAIAWARSTLAADRHESVHTEEVKVPGWERCEEEAAPVPPAQ